MNLSELIKREEKKRTGWGQIAHMIGRVSSIIIGMLPFRRTVDATIPDYEWWDKFRHSRIAGYEIAGSAAKTISEIITSWVFGKGATVKLTEVKDARMKNKVDYTNDMLGRFTRLIQSDLLSMHDDYLGLGDIFVAVNPDGTLVSIPPNTVEVLTDEENPKEVTGYQVTTVTDKFTIVEKFTKEERVRTVFRYTGNAPNNLSSLVASASGLASFSISPSSLDAVRSERFPNLIGKIPIVHFANNLGINELRGHPFVEDIKPILSEFDDLLGKSMQGAKVSGNPLPVFENLEDPEETIKLNSTIDSDEYEDKDGNDESRVVIKWDTRPALFLGAGGKFTFASPPVGFSTDTIGMLKFFRELIRDAAHTPGYVFGGDTTVNPNMTEQTPAWVKFIDGRRDKFCGRGYDDKLNIEASGGLYELFNIWLLTMRLADPKILVAPVTINWTALTEDDEKVEFEKIKWIHSRGGIRTVTALELLNLVDNPVLEASLGKEEMETTMVEQQKFDDFGGTGNEVKNPPITEKNKPDTRAGNGADSPRMPAFGGGGRNGNN